MRYKVLLLLGASLYGHVTLSQNCYPITEARYRLPGGTNQFIYAITPASAGVTLLAGSSASVLVGRDYPDADAWVAKVDMDDTFYPFWIRSYGTTTNLEVATWIAEQPDRSLIVAVAYGPNVPFWRSPSNAGFRLRLLWLDAAGNVLRDQPYPFRISDLLGAVRQTSDGSLIVAGMYHSGDQDNLEGYGDDDLWIAKINPEGEIVWDQLFGGSRDDIVSGGVFETEDGGIVVIASSRSPVSGNKQSPNFGDYDAWVVRLDSNGNKIWDRSYGTAGEQIPTAAAQFPNGDLLLASVSIRGSDRGLLYGNRDLWVLRLDQTGRKLWSRTLGSHGDDYAGSVIPWHDREAIISGYSYSPVIRRGTPAGYNLWLLRLGQHGATLWDLPIGTSDREVGGRAFMEATDGEFYLGGILFQNHTGRQPRVRNFQSGSKPDLRS